MMRQLDRWISPLRNRVANSIARAVVTAVNSAGGMQVVQLGVLAGETVDDGEHFEPYGFTSRPQAGAEAVVLFPNGDRSQPLVVAVGDRRYRIKGLADGEAAIYNDTGAKVVLLADGNIRCVPKAGGRVDITDSEGTPLLVTDGLVHGSAIDTFTGSTYFVLGATSAHVRAKK
jgi:phage baseplate assembly protein V